MSGPLCGLACPSGAGLWPAMTPSGVISLGAARPPFPRIDVELSASCRSCAGTLLSPVRGVRK